MKRTLHVTAEDIQKHKTDSSYSDPIQVALEREGFGRCVVTFISFISFAAFSFGDPVKTVPLPMHVSDRLKTLNLGKEMKPFEFDIEV